MLPLDQRNQNVYNQFEQVTSQIDFNGDTINYTYNPVLSKDVIAINYSRPK